MSEDVGDESQMEYISSSENDDVVDENTRVKTIEEGNDGETTSSDDDIGGGARNLTSKITGCFIDTEFTSSDDDIGGGARNKTSKKGKIINIRNCNNVQVGKTNKQQIQRLDGIEERFTAMFTRQQETIDVLQQTVHTLQDKDTEQQESIVENKQIIRELQHSFNIQQEEIQSLKMKVNPNTSIESSPPPKVANQNKDVKLSFGNLNEEVLSDKRTKQMLAEIISLVAKSRNKGIISEEYYQWYLSQVENLRNKGIISEEKYQRQLANFRNKGIISEEEYQRQLANSRELVNQIEDCQRELPNLRNKGIISEEEYQSGYRR